jgi:hypothetical protein
MQELSSFRVLSPAEFQRLTPEEKRVYLLAAFMRFSKDSNATDLPTGESSSPSEITDQPSRE